MNTPATSVATVAPSPLAYFASATLKAFNTNKTSWIGLAVFLVVIALAILAPVIAPFDPTEQNILEKLRPPSLEHWLGTDSFGRDTLSRVLYGARISLIIGIVSSFAAMVFGTAIGLLAGWHGGRIDTVTMQAMDVLLAFPSLILGLILVAMLGPSMTNIIIAIALTSSAFRPHRPRADHRGQGREFIDAGRALGYSDTRILTVHILPNMPKSRHGSLWLANAIGRRLRARPWGSASNRRRDVGRDDPRGFENISLLAHWCPVSPS
jgi:peptide/nickel transport system permease protein